MKKTLVRNIMSTPVEFLSVGDSLDLARHLMKAGRIRHLPVIDGDERPDRARHAPQAAGRVGQSRRPEARTTAGDRARDPRRHADGDGRRDDRPGCSRGRSRAPPRDVEDSAVSPSSTAASWSESSPRPTSSTSRASCSNGMTAPDARGAHSFVPLTLGCDGTAPRRPRAVDEPGASGWHSSCCSSKAWTTKRPARHRPLRGLRRRPLNRVVDLSCGPDLLGAAQTVTGSKHLLRTSRASVLLDCGLFQGRRREAFENNRHLPIDVGDLDAVVLSHAHIDHSGALPLLCRARLRRADLRDARDARSRARSMLRDAAMIQEADARYINALDRARRRRAWSPSSRCTTRTTSPSVLAQMVGLPYHRRHVDRARRARSRSSTPGTCSAARSSCSTSTTTGAVKRIAFTGDLGRHAPAHPARSRGRRAASTC